LAETDEELLTPRLWPKLLTGVEEPPPPINADTMHEQSFVLEPALGVFAALQQATGATPLAGPPHQGQLLWNEREILVWSSPQLDCLKIREKLLGCAVDHPREPQLIVVACGMSGQLNAHRIAPDHLSDITESPEPGTITESRLRHIYCRPLGQIENQLLAPDMPREQLCAAILQQLAVN
jgi:hypothetical protein